MNITANKVLRTVYLDQPVDTELRAIAYKKGLSKNELIRRAVGALVKFNSLQDEIISEDRLEEFVLFWRQHNQHSSGRTGSTSGR